MNKKFLTFSLVLVASIGLAFPQAVSFQKTATPNREFHNWAQTPPMGWNSWDCFATTVTETQTRQHIDFMAQELKEYGWEYIVVDIQWYEPDATGFDYRKNAPLEMDAYGRLLPAVKKFPSAADGAGFRSLAQYAHSKGLKFGVHLMRGIPRQAVKQNTAIKGTGYHAADIADTVRICRWNGDMYGVDMSKPGAQEYYNSVFELLAAWDIDFVKVDDITQAPLEYAAVRKAIDLTGRKIVLSLSVGGPRDKEHVMANANMWRISGDFWDNWRALNAQFARLHEWSPYLDNGHFPDADMLPLGVIGNSSGDITVGRKTNFTPDEQYTLMSLWCIARSPLMYGGDMSKMDPFTLSLLTNQEVIDVNQKSSNNHQLFNADGLAAWVADVPGSGDKYVALFNRNDKPAGGTEATGLRVVVKLSDLGFDKPCKVRDLWTKKNLGGFTDAFSQEIRFHGAGLYRISQ